VTILVLFILATAWVAALLPPWLRKRNEGRPADSILSFRQQLSIIGRATPAGVGGGHVARPVPPPGVLTRSDARRRRRDILFTLAAATVLTSAMALVLQGVAIAAFLVVGGLLFTYTALLIQVHKRSVEREAKVRYLVTRQSHQEPALLLRRSASN